MHEMETICLRCHQKCHLVAVVEDGKITKIKDAACIKGTVVPDVMYHKDRVIYPKKRVGKRGEGKWEYIPMDQAISEIAAKLKGLNEKFGYNQLFISGGSGQKQLADQALNMAKRMFPAPNIHWARYTCVTPATFAGRATVGERLIYEYNPDLRHAKCIIFWGSNPDVTIPNAVRHAKEALKEGAKLIVVDPRPTPMARRADIWLKIRPGTDAALALAMGRVIIDENLYDKEFVDNWCFGFDHLKEHLKFKGYTPEWAEKVTWLPKEQIIEAARLYAATKPATIYPRLGGGAQHCNATQIGRSICILVALTGNVDAKGGNLLFERPFYDAMMPSTYMTRFACRIPSEGKKMFGYDMYPILAKPGTVCDMPSVVRGMHNGGIRSLWCCGDNIVSAEPNSKAIWDAMLNKLELIWVDEYFMTPTAELADYVLPAAFYQEVDNIVEPFVPPANYVTASKKVVEPPGECRDDRQIAIDIAKAMGVDVAPWDTVMDYLNWNLRYQKITFEELWNLPGRRISCPRSYWKYKNTKPAFLTPTGKCELYSKLLERYGVAPLPDHIEPPDSPMTTPEVYKDYPLIYVHYRIYGFQHSEGRMIERQRKLMPDPLLEIAPETAEKLGIQEGDDVWLEIFHSAKKGDRIYYKAKLVPDLMPQVVCGPHGWWFPEKPAPEHGAFDSNINALLTLDPPYDPVVGVTQAQRILCRIGKVEASKAA